MNHIIRHEQSSHHYAVGVARQIGRRYWNRAGDSAELVQEKDHPATVLEKDTEIEQAPRARDYACYAIQGIISGGLEMFLLFAGNDYYPIGGAFDFESAHDTLPDAIAAHDPEEYKYSGGWANIFDTSSLTIVKSFMRGTWTDGG
jgi:hypothetical protein